MKSALLRSFLLIFLAGAGCDQPLIEPVGAGSSSNFLPWLQTMNKIRVTYTGETDVHSFVKQGTLDPGNTSDLWLTRDLEFENADSTYTLNWQDSQFQTKACFTFRQSDPSFVFSSDCGDQSLIRGVFHAGSNSVTSLECSFQKYIGITDPNNYQTQTGTLFAPELDPDSFTDDSISFTIKNWKAGSISLGYSYDERAERTYIKQRQLTGYDTLGVQSPQICRLVFFKE